MAQIVKTAFLIGALSSISGLVVYWFSDRFNDPKKRGFGTVHNGYQTLIFIGVPMAVVSGLFILIHRFTGRR